MWSWKQLALRLVVFGLLIAAALLGPVGEYLNPSFRGVFPSNHWFQPFGFTEGEIPDLKGKHFLVTGANVRYGLRGDILVYQS